MKGINRNHISIFLLLSAIALLFSFIEIASNKILPRALLSNMKTSGSLLLIPDWKATFYFCEDGACQQKGEFSYDLKLPSPDMVGSIIESIGKVNKVTLSHSFSEKELTWMEGYKALNFLIPRAIQKETSLSLWGKEYVKKNKYDKNLTYTLNSNSNVGDYYKRLELSMNIEGLPFFGPRILPIALVPVKQTPKYFSLISKNENAFNIGRSLIIGICIVLISMSLILDHKRSFFFLALFLFGNFLRKYIPFTLEQGFSYDQSKYLFLLLANAITVFALPAFCFEVLYANSKLARIFRHRLKFCLALAGLYTVSMHFYFGPALYIGKDDLFADISSVFVSLAIIFVVYALYVPQESSSNMGSASKISPIRLYLRMCLMIFGFSLHLLFTFHEFGQAGDFYFKNPIPVADLNIITLLIAVALFDVGKMSKIFEENIKEISKNESIAIDIAQSRLFQEQMIPPKKRSGEKWSYRGFYYPSISLAGDWYDIQEFKQGEDELLRGFDT